MPQRMRLGPTSGGSIDTVRALVQLDQTDFQDLELRAETRDLILESATGDVLPGSSNPALGTSATPWPSVSTDELVLAPAEDLTSTFSGGQTKSAFISNSNPGESYIVIATPENDPGNDHGYNSTEPYWNDSQGQFAYDVTETQNAGGGTARIRVFQIKVP